MAHQTVTKKELYNQLREDTEVCVLYRGYTVMIVGDVDCRTVVVEGEHEFGEIGSSAYDLISVIDFIDKLIDMLDGEE